MDLLLYLIKKNEVDIYDIPIADITHQFMEYLRLIQLLDLDSASEFVLMAAILIRIKAQMLLPKPENEDEEEEDPRLELVQKLLEYKRFKELTPLLQDREGEQRNFFSRAFFNFELDEEDILEPDPTSDLTLFQLMDVFKHVLQKAPKPTFHRVEMVPVTIEEQMSFILSETNQKSRILFSELMENLQNRIIIIVTFIAILELIKRRQIVVWQNKPFSEIWIRGIKG
ncbi:segregation/condensation protein A [candidate division KSB1 bacterium]|nr:segregation/condensation protein A [candidate division KSB1 bacterium]